MPKWQHLIAQYAYTPTPFHMHVRVHACMRARMRSSFIWEAKLSDRIRPGTKCPETPLRRSNAAFQLRP